MIPPPSQIVAISLVTAFSLVSAYVYLKKKRNQPPRKWTPVGNVIDLFIYPLKSGRRLEIQAGECAAMGMMAEKKDNIFQLRDRSFIVYGESNNEFKTARTYPRLVLIESSVHDQDHIVFDAVNERPLYVRVPDERSTKVQITLHCNETIHTLDCGDEAASWFSRFLLDQPSGLRLGYYSASFNRDIAKAFGPMLFKTYDKLNNDASGAYSDLTSYLLVNEASFEELKAHSPEPVTVHHYRPNIYVKGETLAAFTEEDWDWIKIGDAVFRNVKPCVRCVLTNINPENGVRSKNHEPLKTLETLNTLKKPEHVTLEGKGPVMGIHLALKQKGKIRVGDVVYVGESNFGLL